MTNKRHPNHRLVKQHRSYTVEEIARLFGNHRNTARRWIKAGLPTVDEKRPMLIRGTDLFEFLQSRRVKNKRRCKAGELYCFRCRTPRRPGGGMVEYRAITDVVGNLTAICPECGCLLHRIIAAAQFEQFRDESADSLPQALSHIREMVQPSLNSDLR
jgi:hypothetical protein